MGGAIADGSSQAARESGDGGGLGSHDDDEQDVLDLWKGFRNKDGADNGETAILRPYVVCAEKRAA